MYMFHGVGRYGSCARGTEETDSNVDLLVLLEGPSTVPKKFGEYRQSSTPSNWRACICSRAHPWMSCSTTGVNRPYIDRRREVESDTGEQGRS